MDHSPPMHFINEEPEVQREKKKNHRFDLNKCTLRIRNGFLPTHLHNRRYSPPFKDEGAEVQRGYRASGGHMGSDRTRTQTRAGLSPHLTPLGECFCLWF